MSETIFLLTLGMPLATVLIVFGMRYFSAVQQAKYRFASDEAYRTIAEKAVVAQSDTAAALQTIDASLADLKARMAAVEKMLKEVE